MNDVKEVEFFAWMEVDTGRKYCKSSNGFIGRILLVWPHNVSRFQLGHVYDVVVLPLMRCILYVMYS